MPRATVDINATKRIDLKSCPGGYVTLRKMTYGQFLERQSLAMKVTMAVQRNGNQNGGRSGQMELEQAQLAVACFEMRHCVASHNLEDDQNNLLDFRIDAAITLLDPVIGQEIGNAIDEMNQLREEELGNSSMGSEGASPVLSTSSPSQTMTP